MVVMNAHKSIKRDTDEILASQGSEEVAAPTPNRPPVLACVIILPNDAEPILSLLNKLAASSLPIQQFPLVASTDCRNAAKDRWLEHSDAAQFLGISKSTLYRYVSQRRIESRKIAGRLEYRQSQLEKLKQDHIRPARLSPPSGGIILSTLNSGK